MSIKPILSNTVMVQAIFAELHEEAREKTQMDGIGTPVFMRMSLRDIMGNCFRKEFPWK